MPFSENIQIKTDREKETLKMTARKTLKADLFTAIDDPILDARLKVACDFEKMSTADLDKILKDLSKEICLNVQSAPKESNNS